MNVYCVCKNFHRCHNDSLQPYSERSHLVITDSKYFSSVTFLAVAYQPTNLNFSHTERNLLPFHMGFDGSIETTPPLRVDDLTENPRVSLLALRVCDVMIYIIGMSR
jgi:hypothetical protein